LKPRPFKTKQSATKAAARSGQKIQNQFFSKLPVGNAKKCLLGMTIKLRHHPPPDLLARQAIICYDKGAFDQNRLVSSFLPTSIPALSTPNPFQRKLIERNTVTTWQNKEQ
jgi:hypothetical protein